MINITTVVGARPQFIKAAALSRCIRQHFPDQINENIIHTGQHYDPGMSQVFFDELNVPAPNMNLNIGSGPHGKQTALMLEGIEDVLTQNKSDFVVLFGDTNSTLAGALAASKLHIPVVHIEAGLRSFNKTMPEEINRITCDHLSTLLFAPTQTALKNLQTEGFNLKSAPKYTIDNPGIFLSGDIMLDNLVYFDKVPTNILDQLGLAPNRFVLCTIHRDNNTDDPERLSTIFSAFEKIAESSLKVVVPLHPRTAKNLPGQLSQSLHQKIKQNRNILLLDPVPYHQMLALEKNCRMIITDSGGIQKEACFFKKPVIITRPETEWIEIVEHGCGIVSDANKESILKAYQHFLNADLEYPELFGAGKTAEFVLKTLLQI